LRSKSSSSTCGARAAAAAEQEQQQQQEQQAADVAAPIKIMVFKRKKLKTCVRPSFDLLSTYFRLTLKEGRVYSVMPTQ
jgi:hypothetical protein